MKRFVLGFAVFAIVINVACASAIREAHAREAVNNAAEVTIFPQFGSANPVSSATLSSDNKSILSRSEYH